MSQPTRVRLATQYQPKSSATALGAGIALLVGGALVSLLGAATTSTPLIVIGAALTIAGTIAQVVGTIRMASNVDFVAMVQRAKIDMASSRR